MASNGTDTARYDRQLRLWGEEGQALLEASHIVLLRTSAVGTETLKNLVLPGIGQFTVIDDQLVDDASFNDFFIPDGSNGKPRAEVTVKLLNELNDRVTGHALVKNPIDIVHNHIDTLSQYSVIIANGLPEETVLRLSSFAWEKNIPLVVVKTNGLIGSLRVVVPEHTVIESKPDNPMDDLRLSVPFPELSEYAANIDLSNMDSTQHSHVPYIVILLQHLNKWKTAHDGALPSTYAEKNAFKDQVIKGAHKPGEENFLEAHKGAYKAYTRYEIKSDVRAILEDPKTSNPTDKFWVLAAALSQFVKKEGKGCLPLMGSLPDMHSSTESYIALQKIYQAKAATDISSISHHVDHILQTRQLSLSISTDDIKKFSKNAAFLRVIRYRSIQDEYNPHTSNSSLIGAELASDADSNIQWYIALRSVDLFQSTHGRLPGHRHADVEEDTANLISLHRKTLEGLGLKDVAADDRYPREMVRYGGSELHAVAALVGGVTSQEIIKLIVHQFAPMNNTWIFNGNKGTTNVYAIVFEQRGTRGSTEIEGASQRVGVSFAQE
ncbi:amyloid beta precursor protein-binding protein 1 [Planoprotostelium fungivorum]|uniref:NEDD8-activating enzyme E1 regulatory subunit n=1 Tax=Planoprotostelium fungivorum TaxID=1890364 RepID=A0A2P6N944_9EUKA|nr:amyloid beta precursor protein-binding protein 1 [Planoprotostelium fungivorum]